LVEADFSAALLAKGASSFGRNDDFLVWLEREQAAARATADPCGMTKERAKAGAASVEMTNFWVG
jgi:hypothetical protein